MERELPWLTGSDALLMIFLVIFSLFLGLDLLRVQGRSAGYRVTVFGEHGRRTDEIGVPPPERKRYAGKLGETIVEWNQAGLVRIVASPCPQKVCENTGWIGPGEVTCCVPNGVVVESIATGSTFSQSRFDGVTR